MIKWPLLLAVVWLAGCTTVPRTPTGNVSANVWPAWEINGRISARRAEQGWHGDMDWRDVAGEGVLRVRGPLGADLFELGYDRTGAWLRARGETRKATDPAALIYAATGMSLPVSGLRFWVQGAPDPGSSYQVRTDAAGHLVELEQSGWLIRYRRFQTVGDETRPARIDAIRDDLEIRMVIRHWIRPEHPAAARRLPATP